MAENKYFAALSQLGFQTAQNFCVGTWRNYAVAVTPFSAKNYSMFVAIRVSQEQAKELKKSLKAALKAAVGDRVLIGSVQPNYVQCTLKFGKVEEAAKDFEAQVEPVTAALWQNGVGPADTCAVTKAPNPDSLCLINAPGFAGYQPVCAAAVRQEDYKLQEKTEENENNGSYGTGIVGALLGAAVGIAINVLIIVLLHFISAWLFALIPIFAFLGYKLLKGKINKASMAIVIAVSILSLPVMVILWLAFEVMKEYNAPFGEALRFGLESITNPEMLSAMSGDLIKMVIFMAIGVFISWGAMRGQLNSTKLQSSKAKLESMRPNPNYQGQQAAPQQTFEAPQQ